MLPTLLLAIQVHCNGQRRTDIHFDIHLEHLLSLDKLQAGDVIIGTCYQHDLPNQPIGRALFSFIIANSTTLAWRGIGYRTTQSLPSHARRICRDQN